MLTVGGAAAASIVSWSDSEIRAIVPDDALTGAIKATVADKNSDEKNLVVLWDNENPQNVGIVSSHWSPLQSQILADGTGGSIIVWNDFRNYDPAAGGLQQINIYAQRLNSRGKKTWNSGEVPLSLVAGGQFSPQLVADDHGGAIVVWQDNRGGSTSGFSDIYAQRIGPSGALAWTSDVAVCTAAEDQQKPKIASDGAGGAIVVWYDHRNNTGYNSGFAVYAQRIDANGATKWAQNGVPIATTDNPQNPFNEIIPDGAGGAIIVWQDYRSGAWQIYAQRINSAGAVQWVSNGIRVSTTAASYQYVARPVSDGAGGAIIAWKSSGGDLYAQRISGSGELQWGSEVPISVAADSQEGLQMTTDGSGGAIITWEDCRAGSAIRDIYAQRVNASGAVQWTTDGLPVSTAAYSQYEPQIIPDGRGGAIITWYDYRNYNNTNSNGILQGVDTFAQRLNNDGEAQWITNGAAISTADLHQMYPKIASDNSGGAVILWEDQRTGSSVDLYAQGISISGKQ